MIKGFRDFILRGNVVDLAVAVVIGAAFGAVITSFVANIITPLIAAIFGQPDFSGLTFTINSSKFLYGSFINAVIAFLLIAARGLLRDRGPDEQGERDARAGAGTGRAERQAVPRVPERDPGGCQALCLLHVAAGHGYGRAAGRGLTQAET